MPRVIEVLEYDACWKLRFEEEAARLYHLLNDAVINVHHIGSTSVPGMFAKPVIDILLEVANLRVLDSQIALLESMKYESRGENGIVGRRFYQKGGDSRTHHVHAFIAGSASVTRHLFFRDYLIAYPLEAKAYSDMKINLAEMHRNDPEAYVNAKSGYAQALEQRAQLWYLASPADSSLNTDASRQ